MLTRRALPQAVRVISKRGLGATLELHHGLLRLVPRALPLLCLANLWLLASCRGLPTGPSLANVELRSISLQATAGNPALCCCRVVGTVRNLNDVQVHVTIKFSGFDGQRSEPISTILYFIKDLPPREQHTVNASGFIVPCSEIKQLTWEVDVKGIAYPPS